MSDYISGLVSIILPNYNAGPYIDDTIQSVLNQSYTQWELWVCDDGSTDGSKDRVEAYLSDSRIKSITNDRMKGQAGARNTALARARGQYIAFLDSDDIWYPSKLSDQLAFMDACDCAFSCTWYDQINKEGDVVNDVCVAFDRVTYSEYVKAPAVAHFTTLYDREKIGTQYMPLVLRSDDHALRLQVLRHVDYIYCLKKKLGAYRLSPGSVSSNKLRTAKAVWHVLRFSEKLSLFKALYYFSFYAFYGVSRKAKDLLYRI